MPPNSYIRPVNLFCASKLINCIPEADFFRDHLILQLSTVTCFSKLWKEELCNTKIEELLSLRNRGRQREGKMRVEMSAVKEREEQGKRRTDGRRREGQKKRKG